MPEESEKFAVAAVTSDEFRIFLERTFFLGFASHLLAEQIITEGIDAIDRFRKKQGEALSNFDMGSQLISDSVETEKTTVIFEIGQRAIEDVIAQAQQKTIGAGKNT